MTTRASSRSLKRVDYRDMDVVQPNGDGGDDDSDVVEIESTVSRRRKKKAKLEQKKDTDFSPDSEVEIVEVKPSSSRHRPVRGHSRLLHGTEGISGQLDSLLAWYDTVKASRKMPWRKDFDPSLDDDARAQRAYEVWVSEIMLQQTQVATVIPYFNAWLERFPTIRDLAAVEDIEEVNRMWKGLGYYRRASLLLKGAKKVVDDFKGRIPANAVVLEKEVPGVGRYTAGAVCSIAYNVAAPAVDGNVFRLFSRLLAIHAPLKGKGAQDMIWNAASTLVSQSDRPGDLNQAFIELGSTVCKPQSPSCSTCPLRKGCTAYRLSKEFGNTASGDIEDICTLCEPFSENGTAVTRFPMKVAKKPPRKEASVVVVLHVTEGSQKWVLMSKRPSQGLLAGLWEFPTVDLKDGPSLSTQMEACRTLMKTLVPSVDRSECSPTSHGSVLHLFSHIRKTYHVISVDLPSETRVKTTGKNFKWVEFDEVSSMNVGKGYEKVWAMVQD